MGLISRAQLFAFEKAAKSGKVNSTLVLETTEKGFIKKKKYLESKDKDVTVDALMEDMTAAPPKYMEILEKHLGITEKKLRDMAQRIIDDKAPIFYTPSPTMEKVEKIGRNKPCPCGSGKKFKRCCGHDL